MGLGDDLMITGIVEQEHKKHPNKQIVIGSLKENLIFDSIIYLNKAGDSVKIQELQSKVWGYQSELETHTVETHIYRLRKKLYDKFKDKDFIVSKKNGYEIS